MFSEMSDAAPRHAMPSVTTNSDRPHSPNGDTSDRTTCSKLATWMPRGPSISALMMTMPTEIAAPNDMPRTAIARFIGRDFSVHLSSPAPPPSKVMRHGSRGVEVHEDGLQHGPDHADRKQPVLDRVAGRQ